MWGCTFSTHLNPIRILQKRIIRIITNSDYLAHTDPLFVQTEILKFDDVHRMLIAKIGYQWNRDGTFDHLSHNYNTRNRSNVLPQFQRLSISQHSLSYVVPKLWNEIPIHVRNSPTLSLFKKLYKDYLLAMYR